MTYLTLDDFEVITNELKNFFKKYKDPLPAFEESYFDKLDSVIASPRRTFTRKDLYPNLFDKAACYFYFINKLHPFSNANKRISIVSTGVFLMYNGYEFTAREENMYEFAKQVTLSNKDQKTEFDEVIAFIKKNSRRQIEFVGPRIISDILRFFKRENRK